MDLGLAGRVGVMTGAGGEVEAAMARLLRDEGADVREARPDRLGDGEQPRSGPLAEVDFLVVFAGDAPGDLRLAHERAVIEPMRAMKAIAPHLAERGDGRIVNVVPPAPSVAGAAALALSRLFADRYAKEGVLVNAIAPAPDAGPEAVAREIAFLCSARASHIAGATWGAAAGVIG
jgi:hypothetical protein